jgi:hypothetical protein
MIVILPIRHPRVLQPTIRPIVDSIAPRQIRVMRERVTTPIELGERSARIGAILERVGNDARDVARYIVGAVFTEILGSVPGLDNGLAGGIGSRAGIGQVGDFGWDGSYEGTRDYVNCASRFVRYWRMYLVALTAVALPRETPNAKRLKMNRFDIIVADCGLKSDTRCAGSFVKFYRRYRLCQ